MSAATAEYCDCYSRGTTGFFGAEYLYFLAVAQDFAVVAASVALQYDVAFRNFAAGFHDARFGCSVAESPGLKGPFERVVPRSGRGRYSVVLFPVADMTVSYSDYVDIRGEHRLELFVRPQVFWSLTFQVIPLGAGAA